MLKQLAIALGGIMSFTTPLGAQADCSTFDSTTRTLHVHTWNDKEIRIDCGMSAGSPAAPVAPVANSQSAPSQTSPNRLSNTEKLRAFTDLRRQSEYLNHSQHYYGQR